MGLLQQASLVITPNAVKAGKLYSVIPNNGAGDLDVVRATSATRVNEQGLVEIPRTNLLLQSDMFANALWVKDSSFISPNDQISPDGTLTADTFTANGTTAVHQMYQNGNVTSGITYTNSIFAKKGTNDFIQLTGGNVAFGLNSFANFDLNNGTVGTVGSTTTASIQNIGNGWYRCIVTFTAISTTTIAPIIISIVNSSSAIKGQINNLSTSVYLWGAQVEQGVTATEYIPTTSVIRTRFAGITQDGGSASNIPRIDYTNGSCPSILVEPQRTNLIRNSSAIGAVVGSPGTLPTNWSVFASAGLTTTVVGLGIEKGLNYVDIKISGTATSTPYVYRYQSETFVNATLNQPYTISAYFKKVQNNLPTGFGINIVGRTSISAYSETIASTVLQSTMTNDLQRYVSSGTCVNTNTVYIDSTVRFDCVIGQYYDFTFRVSAPQLEAGANATSYIPTTTSSVTRNADVISKSGISSLIGQTEGTIFFEYFHNTAINAGFRNVFSLEGNVSNQFNNINFATTLNENNLSVTVNVLGVSAISGNSIITAISQGWNKVAFGYNTATNGTTLYLNGNLIATRTLTGIPSMSRIAVMARINSYTGFDTDRQYGSQMRIAALFPTRLSNTELAQLTTL